MRELILTLLIFIQSVLYAQNLILNPSFEEYKYLDSKFPIKSSDSLCLYWYANYNSYIFYFHTYSTDPNFLAPANIFGSHYPATGEAYIGFALFYWHGGQNFVTGKLKDELVKGKHYKVSFKIQYSSCSRFSFSLFGIKFTKDSTLIPPYRQLYPDYIGKNKIIADIENNPSNFITNDSCWVTIEGIYNAKGGERYITIGGPFYHPGITERIEVYSKKIIKKNKKKKIRFYRRNQDILRLNPRYCEDDPTFKIDAFYLFDDVSVELIE